MANFSNRNFEVLGAVGTGVTLHEHPDFGGRSKPAEVGFTGLVATDFDDVASSITVPAGYCAVLYEQADQNGGYGRWVDLLEDCADLSRYDFAKKTSWVRVFPTQSGGFVYARNSLVNGQFVAGHWERQRANQPPPGPGAPGAAVVAPPAPPSPTPPQQGDGTPVVRDHRGDGGGGRPIAPPPHGPGFDGVVHDHRDSTKKIKHVFVLMLENRSFDHMLGFSAITGTDANTGAATAIDGLTGNESNAYGGQTYKVSRGAPDSMPDGPGHNFEDALEQLCGEGATYPSGGAYPPITNSGYVANHARSHPENPDGAMKCFTPEQVPVLTALAREFLVCDRWFCSLPGPTEPNRMFVHAGTSGSFDNSPTTGELIESMAPFGGIEFGGGTIFDALRNGGVKFRIYAGDHFPNSAELKGVSVTSDIDEYEDFAGDVASASYDAAYTFLEPNYDVVPGGEFDDGDSQHPSGSVAAGERLIKKTYEAIRKSPHWGNSVLIVTYDEHGGFFDHVAPPKARATGSKGRAHGFIFDQLGPRVPTVLVSPLIPKNLISHATFEHSSIHSSLIDLFNLHWSTPRSATSSGFLHLVSLTEPRTDAPMTLPPATGGSQARLARAPLAHAAARSPARPLSDDRHGNLAAVLHSAVAQHLQVAPPGERDAIIARARAIQTQGQLVEYMKEVEVRVAAAKASAGITRSAVARQPTIVRPAIVTS
jgi:phospholipase C